MEVRLKLADFNEKGYLNVLKRNEIYKYNFKLFAAMQNKCLVEMGMCIKVQCTLYEEVWMSCVKFSAKLL